MGEGAFAPAEELGELPQGWRWARLQELIDQNRGICYGIVQPGKHDPSGVPMVNSQDVVGGRVSPLIEFRVSRELHKRYRRSTILGGEVLLTLVGANFGQVAIAPPYLAGFNCSRAVGILPVTECPEFVGFCLRSPLMRRYMDNWANTTAQPTFNLRDVASLPIPLPPKSERDAIAHILGTLDDKIEVNRRMNETLEAMARALFKSWFVDFDPVRAKHALSSVEGAEGRDPGLPQPLADLFPDSFEDLELGEIPKGWVVKSIGDLAEVVGGTTPSTKERAYWEGGWHAWATPKDLSALSTPVLLDTERRITDAGLAQIGSGLLPKGTVLLSSRAPIGYLAIAETPVAINQGFIAMMPNGETSNLFLLLWASVAHEDIVSRANGSTFLEISKASFRPIPVVTPPADVMHKFDRLARPLYERVVECELESRTLAALRDTLLPKLISGELRVGDSGRFSKVT